MILDKQDAISGYRRAYRIIVNNPKDATPELSFELEWIVDKDGTPISLPAGSKTIQMTDPATPLTIVNPLDDSTIMTANDGFVQAVLYSLYLRDIAGREV